MVKIKEKKEKSVKVKSEKSKQVKITKPLIEKIDHSENNILVDTIVDSMKEKSGNDIAVLNFHSISNSFCDYFIICHGQSKVQVVAIAEYVEENVNKILHIKPHKKEGIQNAEWVLLDYFDVIVHVFLDKSREFYKLENLWADAEIKKIENN